MRFVLATLLALTICLQALPSMAAPLDGHDVARDIAEQQKVYTLDFASESEIHTAKIAAGLNDSQTPGIGENPIYAFNKTVLAKAYGLMMTVPRHKGSSEMVTIPKISLVHESSMYRQKLVFLAGNVYQDIAVVRINGTLRVATFDSQGIDEPTLSPIINTTSVT